MGIKIEITFLVVTYNQKKTILYTLESIKYQIKKFLYDKKIQIIVADDASQDGSYEIIQEWLRYNKKYFEEIDSFRNRSNKGIIKNLQKAISFIKGEYLKMIAGDDMLPCESINPFFECLKRNDLVLGLPIYFSKDTITKELSRMTLQHLKAEYADCNIPFSVRLNRSCFIHGSSVYLRSALITNENVLNFMNRFDFLEDYQMWYAIAQQYPGIRYKFLNRIAVLYRRTDHSAYMTSSTRIFPDRILLCKYMLRNSQMDSYSRLVKWNELILLQTRNWKLLRLFLITTYIDYVKRKRVGRYAEKWKLVYKKAMADNQSYIQKIQNQIKRKYSVNHIDL